MFAHFYNRIYYLALGYGVGIEVEVICARM